MGKPKFISKIWAVNFIGQIFYCKCIVVYIDRVGLKTYVHMYVVDCPLEMGVKWMYGHLPELD